MKLLRRDPPVMIRVKKLKRLPELRLRYRIEPRPDPSHQFIQPDKSAAVDFAQHHRNLLLRRDPAQNRLQLLPRHNAVVLPLVWVGTASEEDASRSSVASGVRLEEILGRRGGGRRTRTKGRRIGTGDVGGGILLGSEEAFRAKSLGDFHGGKNTK